MTQQPNHDQIGGFVYDIKPKDSPHSDDAKNENQVSSDGSQPNPQDDMNSQKISNDSNKAGSPSDQNVANEDKVN